MQLFEYIKLGTHYRDCRSRLSNPQTKQVINGMHVAKLDRFLIQHPVNFIEIKEYPTQRWNGMYDSEILTIYVREDRATTSWGTPIMFGDIWSVSYAGNDKTEAMQRTLVHEAGHHLYFTHLEVVHPLVEQAWNDPLAKPVSTYAAFSDQEYFAETFAAYVYHKGKLRDFDPVGYTMVKKVLDVLGVT